MTDRDIAMFGLLGGWYAHTLIRTLVLIYEGQTKRIERFRKIDDSALGLQKENPALVFVVVTGALLCRVILPLALLTLFVVLT